MLCSEIIRRKTKHVFAQSRPGSRPTSKDETKGVPDITMNQTMHQTVQVDKPKSRDNAVNLSQLLFIVGHVAIKQIVHLELCELDFKRRKQEKEKQTPAKTDKDKEDADELDLIGGTTEDDFTEAMAHIRERELLYGPESLLAIFGPVVSEICANNTLICRQGSSGGSNLVPCKAHVCFIGVLRD